MRFQLIDRIDSWEAHRTITARKVTSAAEGYWRGALTMPPGLVLETVCQAATWLIILGSDFARRAVLLSVDDVRWLADVTPGDVLAVTVNVTSMTDEAALVDGEANVDGQTVLRATGILARCATRRRWRPRRTRSVWRACCSAGMVRDDQTRGDHRDRRGHAAG